MVNVILLDSVGEDTFKMYSVTDYRIHALTMYSETIPLHNLI